MPITESEAVSPYLVWKGVWSASVKYDFSDMVALAGAVYICVQTNTGESLGNATYWTLLVTGSGGAGVGTVTTVSVVTANGVSGSVLNPTTTPAITLDVSSAISTAIAALLVSGDLISESSVQTLIDDTITAGGGNVNNHVGQGNPHNQYVLSSVLNELVDDRVADFLVAGHGITLTEDDGANTLTVSAKTTVVALTDGANIATNAALGDNFRVVLGGNRTLDNPTNLIDGQVINYRIKQDGTGTRTLAYGSKFTFPGGTDPVLSTALNSLDFMSCQYDAVEDTLVCVMSKAFA